MKKPIIITLFLLAFAFLALLGTLYGLFNEEVEFVIRSLFVLVSLLVLGYILNSYFLNKKFDIDENVLHLSREILHEINIPISTIQANTSLLKRTLLSDDKALKRLQRIEDSSKRLERLYEELVYSIKKEIHTVEREDFFLDKLILERIEVMKLLNRNPFFLELSPTMIHADKIGFEKMFDNLIENAMKYSEKTKPIVVTLKENILMIEDKGIGMNDKSLVSVFKRYYQYDSREDGKGIGLALVKDYCTKEKIKITIYSKVEEGTIIKLNLSK